MEFKCGDKVWIRDYVDPDCFVEHGVIVNARFSHTFNRYIYAVKSRDEIGQYFGEYLVLKREA